MLLFSHKTTGNPTFQNTENDYVWLQNSNFAGLLCGCEIWCLTLKTDYEL